MGDQEPTKLPFVRSTEAQSFKSLLNALFASLVQLDRKPLSEWWTNEWPAVKLSVRRARLFLAVTTIFLVCASSVTTYKFVKWRDDIAISQLQSKVGEIDEVKHERDHLELKAQNAENALAPWIQLATSKYPNSSVNDAITNVLKVLTHEIPNLPMISLHTLNGLPPNKTNNPSLRAVQLVLRNTNDVELDNFCGRLQLPEPIVETVGTPEAIVGTQLNWRPLLNTNVLVNGSGGRNEGGAWIGGGSMLYPQYVEPCFIPNLEHRGMKGAFLSGTSTGVWELQIDKIPPGGYIGIRFLTSNSADYANYLHVANVPLWESEPRPSSVADTNELRYYFEGQYQFQSEIRPGTQYFFVPLVFDDKSRTLSALPVQSEVGHWHAVFLQFQ